MLRISFFAAAATMLLAQPVLAQAQVYRHHGAPTYRHHVGFAWRGYGGRAPQWRQEGGSVPFGAGNGGRADAFAWQESRSNNFDSTPARRSELDGMVEQQASANGVPASLVHRVIMRESGYNPRAVSSGNYGLMQIRLGTARAMG